MNNSNGSHFSLKVYTVLSIILSFIMVFTLYPQRVLANEYPGKPDNKVHSTQATTIPSLIITTEDATEVTSDSAMLNGTITGINATDKVQVYFEYGYDAAYGNTTDQLDMATNGSFFIRLMNLDANTIYHFRADATDASGTVVGNDASFVTVPLSSTTTTTVASTPTTTSTTVISTPTTAPTTTTHTTTDTTTTMPTTITSTSATDNSITATPSPSQVSGSQPNANITVAHVDPSQETVIQSSDEKIKVDFPAQVVNAPIDVNITEHGYQETTGMQIINEFELSATDLATKSIVDHFNKDLQITIQNTPGELAGLNPDSVRLYYLDTSQGQWVPLNNNEFDKTKNVLTATTDHFTHFGEIGNSLVSGPGQILAASVGLQSGTARYSYPFELPPGPGGFQPKLTLTYDSGSVDEMKNKQSVGSWVGIGWDLSLGSIYLDLSSNIYYLKLNGASYELASTDNINYRTNPDQYFVITRSGNTWSMYDKDGYFYQFGGTVSSAQYYYTGLNYIYYRWDVSLMKDTNGNQAAVTYSQDIVGTNTVRSAYPLTLKYDNNAAEVDFTNAYDLYTTKDGYLRNDDPQTYSNSIPQIMEDRKLTSIAVKFNGNLIRQYNFGYTETSATTSTDYGGIYYAGTLTLSSITQVGADGTSTLPATSFSYTNEPTYRSGAEATYNGNPGNPAHANSGYAAFNWPHLTEIDSGYGGSITFSYTQYPSTSITNIWSREVVTIKTTNPGNIGTSQTVHYYYYDSNGTLGKPSYLGLGWQQVYRGFNKVKETDAANNYIVHYYYTTGQSGGVDQDKLTGLEYDTQWYNSSGTLLKETTYNWGWVNTSSTYNVKWIWNNPGAGNSYIITPVGVASNGSGLTYVADQSGNSIQQYDEHGNFNLQWGSSGSGNGQFNTLQGVALDSSGYVYVPDGYNYRVQKFSSSGTYSGAFGSLGSGNGQFNYPYGVVTDSSGDIYVTDHSNNRVQEFNSSLAYVTQWGNGRFSGVTGIARDSSGKFYVLDYGSNYIRIFNSSGSFLYSWGGTGGGNGYLYQPTGIAIDSSNNVYVADTGNNRIEEFSSSGSFINAWSNGKADKGVACSTNSMYVAETTTNHIEEYIKNWTIQLNSTTTTMGSQSATTTYTYDSYGNVVTQAQTSSISSENSTTYREFHPNTTANILDKMAREYVQDSGSNTVKDTRYYYDNNSAYYTQPSKGNLTKIEQQYMVNGNPNPLSIYTNYGYDTYGNQTSVQDPNGNTTSTSYDTTYHMYPATKTYPNSSTESYTYDPGTTNLLTQVDVNGQTTTYGYDTFKRLTSTIRPLGSSPDILYAYNSWGTIGSQNITTTTYIDSTHTLWQAQYFDGIGRVVQVQNNGESGHAIISNTTTYNNCGEVANQYVSQDVTPVPSTYQTPGSGWNSTSYTYDGLGRVLVQTNPDSTQISNNYSNAWETTVTNALGHKKNYYYDAYQNLIKVEELDSNNNVYSTTNYTYDVLSNLKQAVDNASNTTTMTYNWLSQKTAMTDPDMGSWSYQYDNNGNLTSQTDAKNQTITMVYDNMNRLTNKNYPSGSGMTNVTYSYDSVSGGNYGKGHRTGMTDAAGSISYTYDTRGRETQELRTINSNNYTTSFTYDGSDRITTITYPSGETVTQAYNGRGLPNMLSGSTAGSMVTGTTYNALGLITQITLGNTLKTTYGYYGTGGTYDTTGGYYGRLWEIKTLPQAGGTALQDVQHTWDAVGNLSTRQDVLASETETFVYDFLDRLTGVSGPYTESFTYNTIDNILSKNGTSYTYGDANHKHAVTAVGSTSYAYDANGNMTTRGSQTITWDVENRPVTVSGGASFIYDGDGNRIKKAEGGQTTLYINKYYEKNITTGVATSNYYLGDKLIAEMTGTTLTYVHQDALSGTSLTTSNTGTSTGTIKYFSFGDCRNSSGNLPAQRFTGQRLDTTGLYYYGGRYYDPTIGRFISPDTIVPNPSDPQSLNRYSYCVNNPLKNTDPTGHSFITPRPTLPIVIVDPVPPTSNTSSNTSSTVNNAPSMPVTSTPVTTTPPATSTPTTTATTSTNNRGVLETIGQTIFDTIGKANSGVNNLIGNVIGTLSGGTSRSGPGGTTIYENVNPNSPTGWLLNGLHAEAFTVGYVIITGDPHLPTGVEQHELGHVTQAAILGPFYLPIYGICVLAAGGWNGTYSPSNNIIEVGPLHPNWPAR